MAATRDVPPLVGKAEAAEIIGVNPNNMVKLVGLPDPLQAAGIRGFAVRATPLWRRADIVAFARKRNRRTQRVAS